MTRSRRDEFEALFTRDPDPWAFRTSPYEAAKFAATIDALGGRRFDHALDIGCANGVLTARLAARCHRVLAVDVADSALALARGEVAQAGHDTVDFLRADVPTDWPDAQLRFDLILLSEVLYFIGADEIAQLARRLAASARSGGRVLAVNTTGSIATGLSGTEAEGLLARHLASLGWAAPKRSAGPGWRMAAWDAP